MDKAQKQLLKSYYRARVSNKGWYSFEEEYAHNKFTKEFIIDNDIFHGDDINEKRAKYFNSQIFKKNIFSFIGDFSYVSKTLAIAYFDNGSRIFINKQGQPSIEGFDDNEVIKLNANHRAIYYNQKLNTNFRFIDSFIFANKTIAYSSLNTNLGGRYLFINKEGQPSVEGITDNEINMSMDYDERAVYLNQKLNTNIFINVSPFNLANNTLAMVTIKNKNNFIVNKEGQPSVEGITNNEIDRNKRSEILRLYYNNTLNMINNG